MSKDDRLGITSIDHTTYNVRDKEVALHWYTEVLGLKQVQKMTDEDHVCWLQVPSGTMLHLVEKPDAPSKPIHHAAFEVDDIRAAESYFRSKQIETTDIQTRNDGQQAFYIYDPDGNCIEICTKSSLRVRNGD